MHTWGKTVDQALTRLKETAAMGFDTDENSITHTPRPVLPKAADRTVEAARQVREQTGTADRRAIEQTPRAAVTLTSRGIRMRDAAASLGISHQRLHQLITAHTPPHTKVG